MYLKKLAEQVIRRYEAGDPSRDSNLELREVYLHLIQCINKNIKLEHLNVNLPLGEYVPPYASIATYPLTIVGTGLKTVEFTRTNIGAPLTDQYYVNPNGQYWVEEDGDYWVAAPASATITITEDSTAVYTVEISGLTEVNGISYQDIADFFSDASTFINPNNTAGYIEINQAEGTSVTRFGTDGIKDVDVIVDGISFTYDLTATVNTDSEITDLLQVSHQAIGLAEGSTAITFVTFDLYTLTTNTVSDTKATATLPTQPIQLPRGMGVWKVFSNKDRNNPFIPLGSNDGFLHGGVLSDSISLLNTYEYFDNKTITFNSTADQLPDDMRVQLIVVDTEQLSETDLLPIPADMEEQVIVEVLNILGRKPMEDNLNDGNPDIR